MSATSTASSPELDEGLELVIPGKSCDAGAGWTWVTEGWALFAKAPLMWIIGMVICFIIAIVMGLVPFIGSVAYQIIQPVLAAGFMVAARKLEQGGEFELEHLFAGFNKRLTPLLIVGIIFLVGWIILILIFMVFVGFGVAGAILSGNSDEIGAAMAASIGMIVLGGLVLTAAMIPLMAAYWFAPVLVMIHDVKPVEAMKASFFACFRNFMPFLIYSLVMMGALIVALIPLGLGLLVWVPLAITSTYAAYRHIFTRDVAVEAAPLPVPV